MNNIIISIVGNRFKMTLSTEPVADHYGGEIPGDVIGYPEEAATEFNSALEHLYKSGTHKYLDEASLHAFSSTIQRLANATRMYGIYENEEGVRPFELGVDKIRNWSLN